MSTINLVAPGHPVVTVTLPAVTEDVWGIEIRASDNTTVLYAGALMDTGFYPIIGLTNTTTSLSYYVYTFNLIGEYSAAYNLTASAPNPGYTVSYKPGVGGVTFAITPTTDLSANHYEAYWNLTGTTPAATQKPNWAGDTNAAGTFTFAAGELPGQTLHVWVRAVGESTLAQAWTALTNQTVKFIDPSTSDVLTKGSIPGTLSDGFAYTATTTNLSWTWAALIIYRVDGTTTNPADSTESNSSLTSGTTYYFYPYYDESLALVKFVNGSGHGTSGSAFLSAQRTSAVAQSQCLRGRIPLANGPISAATTSSGTGGGSGGGGGSCVRSNMLVLERTKGTIPAREVQVGDWLSTTEGDGWTQVIFAEERPQDLFIRVKVHGHYVEVTPTHPFKAMDENCNEIENLPAGKLSCMHQLYTCNGADFVSSVELVRDERAKKMVIACEKIHTFLSGEYEPYILTHNLMMVC